MNTYVKPYMSNACSDVKNIKCLKMFLCDKMQDIHFSIIEKKEKYNSNNKKIINTKIKKIKNYKCIFGCLNTVQLNHQYFLFSSLKDQISGT